jgi:3D (Asp-Asp-Asp) domain-containing protein
MIAAPKTYDFGTRIDFDGLGVGIVEDRGGAIVKA